MYNKLRLSSLIILILTANLALAQQSVFKNFISVKDGKLMDGDKEFRFISFNIPNLNYVEDEFDYSTKHPYRMPDTYEIADAMESIKQLGGNVIRNYTFPVRNIKEEPYPTYVIAPGEFDEQSFKTMDTLLAIANQKGVRVILPFVNNWQWMGGRPQYADFRGKNQDDFWSDPQLIEDVKTTINFVVNRKNTVTGVLYKDDKSIFCWETGNELYSTPQWTATICRYIKSLDQNHLIMDGFNAIDGIAPQTESFTEPSVDIVSTHHYETDPAMIIQHIKQNSAIVAGRKPYIVGEFGFVSTPAIEKVLDYVINDKSIAGAMIWSLRHHRKEGGFYWHSEPLGGGIYKAYHWPGFASGIEYDEKNLLNVMQKKAFEIQGLKVPEVVKPAAPKLLPISEPAHISWQGSVGASSYNIERAVSANGPWQLVGFDVDDASVQYFSLFNDTSVEFGQKYFYRVIAKNLGGNSEPSNVVGPVKAERKCLIDDMVNFGTFYHKNGNVSIVTDNDRSYREKTHRILGDVNAELIYVVNGNLKACNVYAFSEEDAASLEFYVSTDNKEYSKVEFERSSLFAGKGDYGYWVPCTYTYTASELLKASYVKIVFKQKTQMARVEAYYAN